MLQGRNCCLDRRTQAICSDPAEREYNYPDITLVLSSALLPVTAIDQTQWNPKNKGGIPWQFISQPMQGRFNPWSERIPHPTDN